MKTQKKFLLFPLVATIFGLVCWLMMRPVGSQAPSADVLKRPQNWQVALVRRGLTELANVTAASEQPSLLSAFGPRENMPESMRLKIRHNLGGVARLHLRFGSAQLLHGANGVSMWLVGGRGVTCLIRNDKPATACRTSVLADREGVWLGTYATTNVRPGTPVRYLAFGVTPQSEKGIVVRSGPLLRRLRVPRHIWVFEGRSPIRVNHLPDAKG